MKIYFCNFACLNFTHPMKRRNKLCFVSLIIFLISFTRSSGLYQNQNCPWNNESIIYRKTCTHKAIKHKSGSRLLFELHFLLYERSSILFHWVWLCNRRGFLHPWIKFASRGSNFLCNGESLLLVSVNLRF